VEVFDELIGLQAIDIEIAQLEHKARNLPEAAVLRAAERRVDELSAQLRRVMDESARLSAEVEANEGKVGDLRRQVDRLNAQLKTVIAPREAEALQHEIAVVCDKMSALDDESLVAIERSDELDAELSRIDAETKAVAVEVDDARHRHAEAADAVAGALDQARRRRGQAAGSIDADWIAKYEQRRGAHAGIAVARLVKATCGGCHVDLSTSEVEIVRRQPATERECPNCARWLVV